MAPRPVESQEVAWCSGSYCACVRTHLLWDPTLNRHSLCTLALQMLLMLHILPKLCKYMLHLTPFRDSKTQRNKVVPTVPKSIPRSTYRPMPQPIRTDANLMHLDYLLEADAQWNISNQAFVNIRQDKNLQAFKMSKSSRWNQRAS